MNAPAPPTAPAPAPRGRLAGLIARGREMVLALSEDPHGNAKALAWGTFVSVVPGVGAMLVVLLAGWVRRERRLAFISSLTILNFYTIPPFYLASYRLGCSLLRYKPMKAREFMARLHFQPLLDTRDFQFFIDQISPSLQGMLKPFGLGLLVLGVALSLLVYAVAFPMLRAWHRRRVRKGKAAPGGEPLVARGVGQGQEGQSPP